MGAGHPIREAKIIAHVRIVAACGPSAHIFFLEKNALLMQILPNPTGSIIIVDLFLRTKIVGFF
jgi:hypothetical protein